MMINIPTLGNDHRHGLVRLEEIIIMGVLPGMIIVTL